MGAVGYSLADVSYVSFVAETGIGGMRNMNTKRIWALVLMGLLAIVLIMTRDSTSVNLIVTEIKGSTSLVLLASIAVGVVIGILFK